jgi:8-oxo-dGTP pyrophosphatase MutT (NUDIX family)
MNDVVWKRLASRVLLSHPRLQVFEDEVELPDGYRTTYLRFGDEGAAATVLCRDEAGRILLQRAYSYPPNVVMLELPGGYVPAGEDPAAGANRELMEEAGLRAGRLTLLGRFFPNNRRSARMTYVYLGEELTEASLPGDPEEQQNEAAWFTEDEIEELIRSGQVVNQSILAAWSLYRARRA